MKWAHIFVLFLSFILFPFTQAKTEEKKDSLLNEKPLKLKWKVSHLRNTDQIFLIFRQSYVELITNTSSYQKGSVARLGRFKSPLNPKLKKLKEQINQYYIQLKKTVPLSSLIKDSRFKPPVYPHAPILHINEEEIKNRHTYFKPLTNIIYTVWEHNWICVDCAFYKKKKKRSIIRTVKRVKSESKSESTNKGKEKKKWETSKQKFSRKLLDCIPEGKEEVECIDPQFGIFEI